MSDTKNAANEGGEAPKTYSQQLGVEVDSAVGITDGSFADLRLPNQEFVEETDATPGPPKDGVEIGQEGDRHEATSEDGDDTPAEDQGDAEESAEGDAEENAEGVQTPEFSLAKYQQEWDTNGKKLSEKSIKEITKATGLTKDDILSVANAMQAQQDLNVKRWENIMGGKEQKDAAVKWARENYSPAKRAAFNKALDSGDPDLIDIAVQGLSADYRASRATSKNSAVNNSAAPSYSDAAKAEATTPFASPAEHREAVRSQRYKTDPAYREDVKRRLLASSFFKNSRG